MSLWVYSGWVIGSLDEKYQKSKLAVPFASELKPAAAAAPTAAAAASLSWKDGDFDHMGPTWIGSARIQTRNLRKPAALQS